MKLDSQACMITFLLLLVAGLIAYIALNLAPPCAGCNAKVEFVFSPQSEEDVIALIRSAQKTIDIEVYTFTSNDIIRELGEAEKRGVQVRVIMEPRVEEPRKDRTSALLQELGAEMRWASLEYKLTHSKFIIVDDKKALVGSINLSDSALNYNRETAVLLEGEKVKELVAVFKEDWAKATAG